MRIDRWAAVVALVLLAGCVPSESIACGDGERAESEECDDANLVAGDGCSAECTFDEGVCGDGVLHPDEECDLGAAGGAGCSTACESELASCGDGAIDEGEDCDDGNSIDGDGCTGCVRDPSCGDGVIDAGEGCDDGNTIDGDGCSSACDVESDLYLDCVDACAAPDACTMVGEGSLCTRACTGDGECPDGRCDASGVCLFACDDDDDCDLAQRCIERTSSAGAPMRSCVPS